MQVSNLRCQSFVDFGLSDVVYLFSLAPILKLEKDDSEKELEFEIDYQLSLTIQQRFEIQRNGTNAG